MYHSDSMIEAASNGDLEKLCVLLDSGVDLNSLVDHPQQLFDLAYINGHEKFVRRLLETGMVDVDFVNVDKLPLNDKGHLNCLAELLWFKVVREALKIHSKKFVAAFQDSFGKDLNKISKLIQKTHSSKSHERNCQMYSPLLFLLLYDSECPAHLYQELIDYGANVNAIFYGFEIWVYSIICENVNGLEVLLENGCCVKETVSRSLSPFYYAIQTSSDSLNFLLRYSDIVSLDIWKEKGIELVLFAVDHGQNQCVEVLLKYGATVDRPDHDWVESPLIAATKNCNASIVDILLQHGADVDWANNSSETALIHAALTGFTACMDLLISHRANINAVDCDKESALMHAIQRGHVDCVRSLITAGANTSLVSVHGHTALLHATISVHSKNMIELIMTSTQFQPDVIILNKFHKDAFMLALRQFDAEILLILLKHGIFAWNWLDSTENEAENLPTEILARVLVAAAISPGCFQIKGNSTTTLFQSALVAQDIWTAYYLIANLYLSEQDYKHLQCDTYFLLCLKEKGNADVLSLVKALTFRPLPLQTLCILTLSTELDLYQERIRRRDKIAALPIPDKFKRVLSFQGAYSKFCVDEWKLLGTKLSKMSQSDLMSTFKTLSINSRPCEEMKCGDNAAGYRMRFNLLKQRTRPR